MRTLSFALLALICMPEPAWADDELVPSPQQSTRWERFVAELPSLTGEPVAEVIGGAAALAGATYLLGEHWQFIWGYGPVGAFVFIPGALAGSCAWSLTHSPRPPSTF